MLFLGFYAIIKDNPYISYVNVTYYTSAIVALLFFVYSIIKKHLRGRGFDPAKVRKLKEVIPRIHLYIIFTCAFFSSILIPLLDDFNMVFWAWVILFSAYALATLISIRYRNEIVRAYYYNVMFPWPWANIVCDAFVGGLFGLIFWGSLNNISGKFVSCEFELSLCIAGLLVMLYFLLKIQSQDNVVRLFDEVIDGFIYKDESKEAAFHKIVLNRMGYSVLDACNEELKLVGKKIKRSDEEEKELDDIKTQVMTSELSYEQLEQKQSRIKVILDHQQEILNLSDELTSKMDKIAKVSFALKDITEFEVIFDTNKDIYNKVNAMSAKVREISKIVHEKQLARIKGTGTLIHN